MDVARLRALCPDMPAFPGELAILDEHNQVVLTDIFGFLEFELCHRDRKEIGRHEGKFWKVSTDFVCAGLRSGNETVHFETMITGPNHYELFVRYKTYAEAKLGHDKIVQGIEATGSPHESAAVL